MNRLYGATDHAAHRASDFGSGTIELYFIVTGDVSLSINVDIKNVNDRLDIGSMTIVQCVDEGGNAVVIEQSDAVDAATKAIEEYSLMDDYERAVFAAQRERASEPDDGW